MKSFLQTPPLLNSIVLMAFGACILAKETMAEETNEVRFSIRKHQSISTHAPPVSPAERPVDSGAPPVNRRRLIQGPSLWDRRRFISTHAPPSAPANFNPDPGLKSTHTPVQDPFSGPRSDAFYRFYPEVPQPLSTHQGPPISPELALPPNQTYHDSLEPVERGKTNPTYGTESLAPNQALPRVGVRANEWQDTPFNDSPRYPLTEAGNATPPHFTPRPDRYRVGFGFTPWHRYPNGVSEQPFQESTPYLWHPYYQSRLKGDLPVIGQNIFLNLSATSDSAVEFRTVPTPSSISASRPDSAEVFGRSDQLTVGQTFGLSVELFEGEAAFKPTHWAIKLLPVFNINYNRVQENNLLSTDPRGIDGGPNNPPPFNGFVYQPSDIGRLLSGQLQRLPDSLSGTPYTERTKSIFTLQEYSAEYHLGDLTDNYDFVALKAGSQGFNNDFRGFLFNDVNLGGRLFGNYDNNRWQYNVVGFDMREKDTFSGLNTFDSRHQRVFLANAYRQDFLWEGYTTQLSFSANQDDPGTHYDRAGGLVRPAPLGTVRPHDVQAYYLGWAGDGHIGRFNISHQLYQALGTESFNQIAGKSTEINAQFAAVELSYDQDWLRYKTSFVYASGDHNVRDKTATGFDGIIDNPNFTGGEFSYYVRQGLNFGGTGVGLKQPNSLLPNLRTSKTQGQANFVNPGIFVYSVGLEIDTTPKWRTFLNFNYVRFAETDPLQTVLQADNIRNELGFDLSVGVQFRPLLTDNIIITVGLGTLLPGAGYRDIYRRSTDPTPGYYANPVNSGKVDAVLYSGVFAINLTY